MKQDSDRPGEIADGEPPRIAGLRASLGPVADSLKEQTSEHFAEVRRALFDLRSAPALARPERGAHLQRFIYGFGLPFRILRALFRDPAAKRQYLRVILTQLTIVLGLRRS